MNEFNNVGVYSHTGVTSYIMYDCSLPLITPQEERTNITIRKYSNELSILGVSKGLVFHKVIDFSKEKKRKKKEKEKKEV